MSYEVRRMNAAKLQAEGLVTGGGHDYEDDKAVLHATTGDDWPEGKPHSVAVKDRREEKLLQRQCEDWLHQHGYARRTPADISYLRALDSVTEDRRGQVKPQRGWQIHLAAPKKNPKLLDLLLLGNDGRFIEVELKVDGGSVDAEQGFLLRCGGYCVYSFEEFTALVIAWEEDKAASVTAEN